MFGVTTSARGSSSARIACDAVLVEQRVAALGNHHRIDDHQRQLEFRDRGSDRLDDRRSGEHAGLRGMRCAMSRATASICAVTRSAARARRPR